MVCSGSNLIPSVELRERLERCATVTRRAQGTILFRRGDAAEGLYMILSGEVSLSLEGENGIFPTRILSRGCIVGLPGTVSGHAYSLTAEVVQEAELAFVPRAAVLDCLREDPVLCFQIMGMLSEEISEIRSAFKATDISGRTKTC